MATVTSMTAPRMLAIEQASVIDGYVDGSSHLILRTKGGDLIDAGYIKGDPGQDATALLDVEDTSTINLTKTGDGTPTSPWLLKADITDIPNVPYNRLPNLVVTGLLSASYSGQGPASVLIDGDTTYTNDIDWVVSYLPWGSRRVSLTRYGSRWVITGQTHYESVVGGHRNVRLTLASGWFGYNEHTASSGWRETAYATQLPSGLVVLSGLIRFPSGAPVSGTVFATGLPPEMRPEKTVPHYVNNADQARYISIEPDGSLKVGVGMVANGYLSLDGIAFWPAGIGDWTPIGSGGSSFGANFEAWPDANNDVPSFWKDPYGFTWFKGLLRVKTATSADNSLMVNLPVSHRVNPAEGAKHMRSAGQNGYAGVGATGTTTGNFGLEWKLGSPGAVGNWISLYGLCLPTVDAYNLNDWYNIPTFINGWSVYSVNFPAPGFMKRGDGLILGKGMMSGGTVGTQRALYLPREFWPASGRIIGETIANNARCRFDISGFTEDDVTNGRTRGAISVINGSNGWVSFDSYKYVSGPI